MFILIDTNIFFNNWFLRNPGFKLLANFCSNTRARIMLSQVVVEEVDAKFELERVRVNRALKEAMYAAGRVAENAMPSPALEIARNYSFAQVASNLFTGSIVPVSYDGVENSVMVKKAISSKRPFRESEKGYRDCLMWLSALMHLKAHQEVASGGSPELVFITKNHTDFCEKGKPLKLHRDLLEDMAALGIKNLVSVYGDLREFIESRVDATIHREVHDELLDDLQHEISSVVEERALSFLNAMPVSDSRLMLESANYSSAIVQLIYAFQWGLVEGEEDGRIVAVRKLDADRIVLDYSFNLRMVSLDVAVATADFQANKVMLEKAFFDIHVEDGATVLDDIVRCDFSASVTVNVKTREVESAAIDSASIRPKRQII